MTIVRPICLIAGLILPDALIRLAVAMLQLNIRAIPAIPYSRFRGFSGVVGVALAAVVSLISSTNSPTVKSIIRILGLKFIFENAFEERLDAFRSAPKEQNADDC